MTRTGVTQGVRVGNDGRRGGRIVVRADDPSLTGHGGLAVIGDLERRLGLITTIDAQLARERRARAIKVRRRGVTPGELVISLAECQLVGGAFFDHLAISVLTGGRAVARGERGALARDSVAAGQALLPGALPADRESDEHSRAAA